MKLLILLTTITSIALSSCNYQENKKLLNGELNSIPVLTGNFEGVYVTESYQKRKEGYDWIAVSISKTDSGYHLSVQSRMDLKKATCSLETSAKIIGKDSLQAVVDGKGILFSFDNRTLSISSLIKSDSTQLYYFCSGGASLANHYYKIDEKLDSLQIRK